MDVDESLVNDIVKLYELEMRPRDIMNYLGIDYNLYNKVLKSKGLVNDRKREHSNNQLGLSRYPNFRFITATHKKHEKNDPPSERQRWAFKSYTKIPIKDNTEFTFFELSDLMVAINKDNGYYRGEGFKYRISFYFYIRNRIHELIDVVNKVLETGYMSGEIDNLEVSAGVMYAHSYLIYRKPELYIKALFADFYIAYSKIMNLLLYVIGRHRVFNYLYVGINLHEVFAYDYRIQNKIFDMFIDYARFLGYYDIYYITYMETIE